MGRATVARYHDSSSMVRKPRALWAPHWGKRSSLGSMCEVLSDSISIHIRLGSCDEASRSDKVTTTFGPV